MSERLLDRVDTSARFGISQRSLVRHETELIAKGLVRVRAGSRVLYQESTIDALIRRMAEKNESLFGGR